MTENNLTPPPELVKEIALQAIDAVPDDELGAVEIDEAREEYIAKFFAQWGANQELEACCKWLAVAWKSYASTELRAARRPKPPSLKEQAIAVLEDANLDSAHYNILLRALEQLPE